MLFSNLNKHIQDKGSLAIRTRLASGHHHVQLLTAENEQVNSLSRTLANSLNLIQDGAPLLHAIAQMDMSLQPQSVNIQAKLDAGCSVVLCDLSQTYALIQHGMYIYYVDATGNTYNCWSHANVRNR